MNEINWKDVWQTIRTWLTSTGVKILIALVLWIVLFKLTNLIFRRMQKRVEARGKADKTLTKALFYIGRIAVKVLIIVGLIAYLGIDTSGLTALIASLGVGAGLAINGTLSNFAGGMLLLVTRPFRVDDYIEAAGYSGTVEEIRIVNTVIRTPDNKVVYIPNGTLSTTSITNYSLKKTRRVELIFSVAYDTDIEKAKAVIREACEGHGLVLQEPKPFVRVSKQADSSIDITARVWVQSGDYWSVHFDLLEAVKQRFDDAGIQIPYPQMDVHIKEK